MSKGQFPEPNPIVFSPEQWQDCQAMLWEEAERVSEASNDLSQSADAVYEDVQARKQNGPNLFEREQIAEQEAEYFKKQRRLLELAAKETILLSLIERIEDGDAKPEEVLPYMPAEEPEESRLSKRRQAILREKEKLGPTVEPSYGVLSILVTGEVVDITSSTDPRRISSGRNRKRVVSANGVDAFEFYHHTADTHGGKSRRAGKVGGSYIGGSGRRVRKT